MIIGKGLPFHYLNNYSILLSFLTSPEIGRPRMGELMKSIAE